MIVWTYAAYLVASLLVTVLLGRTLHRHGRCFVIRCLNGDVQSADAVNNLLLAGFYLVNIAFVALVLKSDIGVETFRQSVDLLSTKLGLVLLTLGVMHFLNLIVLGFLKSRDF
jgi:hypothetical protein